MSIKQQTISGLSWTMTNQLVSRGIKIVVQILLARLISPAEFGLLGMIIIFNAIGTTLVESGMSQSLIRQKDPTDDDYSTVFYTNILLSLFIYAILFFLAPQIANFYQQPELVLLVRVYSLTILINSFSIIQIAKVTHSLNFRLQFIIQIPSIIVGAIIGIVLAYRGYGVWALVWMELARRFVLTIQYWIYTGWKPTLVFDKERLKFHFNFGYKLTLVGLIATFFNNLYPMIIGKTMLAADVGFFTRAETMQKYPVQALSTSLNQVTYPVFSKAKNDTQLLNAYEKMNRIVILITSAIMIGLILVAKPLFIFLLTDQWLPSVPIFQLLCIVGIFSPVNSFNLNIAKVKGKSENVLKASLWKKISQTIAIFVGLPFGLLGLIMTYVIHTFIALIINTIFGGKIIGYTLIHQLRDIFFSVWQAVFTAAIIYLIFFYFYPIQDLTNLVQIVLISCSYLLLLLSLHVIFPTESVNEIKSIGFEFLKRFKNKTND